MDFIIYHDNHLVVCAKPPGLPSQPDDEGGPSAEDRVKAWVKETYHKPGNVWLQAAHRLDRPASGLLVFARNNKALKRLQAAFRERQVHKQYWAVTRETPRELTGTLVHQLVHGDGSALVLRPGATGGQEARLRYRVRERQGAISWLEVDLETGRYHQIRAQLAAIGCPLIGDRRYGGMDHAGFHADAIGLHHVRLELPHPVGGRLMVWRAPVPKNWPIWIRRAPDNLQPTTATDEASEAPAEPTPDGADD